MKLIGKTELESFKLNVNFNSLPINALVLKLRGQDKVGRWFWKCQLHADFPIIQYRNFLTNVNRG